MPTHVELYVTKKGEKQIRKMKLEVVFEDGQKKVMVPAGFELYRTTRYLPFTKEQHRRLTNNEVKYANTKKTEKS